MVPYFAVRWSLIGPDRLFTAVRRHVSYQTRTRHWAVGASTAVLDPTADSQPSPNPKMI
jgi:hypothetical protein